MKPKKKKNPGAVALGRRGGKVRSEVKTAAARENARKGGWVKGRKRGPVNPAPSETHVHIRGFNKMPPETQAALGKMVKAAIKDIEAGRFDGEGPEPNDCGQCGGPGELLLLKSYPAGHADDPYRVQCRDCGNVGLAYPTDAEAIEAWNLLNQRRRQE